MKKAKDADHVNGYTIIAEVHGSAKAPYRVSYNSTLYACNCPAWTQHTPRKDCKHIKRVINVINNQKESTVDMLPEGFKLKKVLDGIFASLTS